MSATQPSASTAGTVSKILKYVGLSFLWMFQYAIYVPTVLCFRGLKGAAKFGFLGVLLICIPILGWIILAWLVFRRAPVGEKPRSVWKPWGIK